MSDKPWEIKAPHASVGLPNTEAARKLSEELIRIPGIRPRGAGWIVPRNAIEVFAELCEKYSVAPAYTKWIVAPAPVVPWPNVERVLRERKEVREDVVLNGFLMPYQKDAVEFGWSKSGVHIWHQTGAGKTLTGLLCCLSVDGPLVIITRAASRLQFGREVERFTQLKPFILSPESADKGILKVGGQTWIEFFKEHMPVLRRAALVAEEWAKAKENKPVVIEKKSTLDAYLNECKYSERRPVLLVGWESLPTNLDRLKALRPGAVLYDECHKGKNSSRWTVVPLVEPEGATDREKLEHRLSQEEEAKRLGGFVKDTEEGPRMFLPVMNMAAAAAQLGRVAKKRVATTATPVKDRVRDLWSQLDMVEPNAFGSKVIFETRHCDRKPGTYGGFDTRGSSNLVELKTRLASIAHILKYEDTHKKLPPKRRQSLYISPEDQCEPASGFARARAEARKRGAAASLELSLMEAATRKRVAVASIVEDHLASGQKVVLFSGRRKDCEDLGKSIQNLSTVKQNNVDVWVAHGEQSQEMRDEIVRMYMAHPGPCAIVATWQAMGESLNLQDTDAAFFVMLPPTPGALRQGEGRFARHGQKRPVIIYYAIAEGTVDEHMAALLIDKLPAVERVVEDTELASSAVPLAGIDENESDEDFAKSILDSLDFG